MLTSYLGRKWATPTCARKSIACVSSVARAGVTPISVAACCTRMTAISTSSTLIHICSSEVTHITMRISIECNQESMVMLVLLSTQTKKQNQTFSLTVQL